MKKQILALSSAILLTLTACNAVPTQTNEVTTNKAVTTQTTTQPITSYSIAVDRMTLINYDSYSKLKADAKTFTNLDNIYEAAGLSKGGYFAAFSETSCYQILTNKKIILPVENDKFKFSEATLKFDSYRIAFKYNDLNVDCNIVLANENFDDYILSKNLNNNIQKLEAKPQQSVIKKSQQINLYNNEETMYKYEDFYFYLSGNKNSISSFLENLEFETIIIN